MRFDESSEASHIDEVFLDLAARGLDFDIVFLADRDTQLQRVDRVETEPVDEERLVAVDLVR